jgi:hypothetical protein
MRHSSGKSSEKRPCDTVPKIGGKDSANDNARRLLEKTHLPVNLYSTTNPCNSVFPARMNLLRQIVIQPDLIDDMQLPFEIVDVMFFVQQDLFEQLA